MLIASYERLCKVHITQSLPQHKANSPFDGDVARGSAVAENHAVNIYICYARAPKQPRALSLIRQRSWLCCKQGPRQSIKRARTTIGSQSSSRDRQVTAALLTFTIRGTSYAGPAANHIYHSMCGLGAGTQGKACSLHLMLTLAS